MRRRSRKGGTVQHDSCRLAPVGFALPRQELDRSVESISAELFAKIRIMKTNSTDKMKWVDALADTISRADHVITMLVELWNGSDEDIIIMTNTLVMISGGPDFVKLCKTGKASGQDGAISNLILCYGNTSQAFVDPFEAANKCGSLDLV